MYYYGALIARLPGIVRISLYEPCTRIVLGFFWETKVIRAMRAMKAFKLIIIQNPWKSKPKAENQASL